MLSSWGANTCTCNAFAPVPSFVWSRGRARRILDCTVVEHLLPSMSPLPTGIWNGRGCEHAPTAHSKLIQYGKTPFFARAALAGPLGRRPNDPLEIWDYGSGELQETIPWNRSSAQVCTVSLLHAMQAFCVPHSLDSGKLDSSFMRCRLHVRVLRFLWALRPNA